MVKKLALGLTPRTQRPFDPRTGLRRSTKKEFVRVDASGQISAPGLWAVGKAVNPRAQVITAAAEGSAAAIAINVDHGQAGAHVAGEVDG